MKKDISDKDDVRLMVDEFYALVRKDMLLSPIFNEHIKGQWQPHLEIMYRFWNAALLGIREYVGNPWAKHAMMPLDSKHFERWIDLFYQTIDLNFEGDAADEAKRKAMLIASTFYRRLNEGKRGVLSELPEV